MPSAKPASESSASETPPWGDSLASGVAFLFTLTVAQRGIGLVRNVLFCALLTDEELGRWSLAFNFLMLAAPLAVLGIPGSFGRYVEHYRQRGQLRSFLRRTTAATAVLAVLAGGLMIAAPIPFAQLLFDDPAAAREAQHLGAALTLVIAFNFMVELLVAMRLIRAATTVQFVSSVAFAGAGVLILKTTRWGEEGALLAFVASTLLATLLGAHAFFRAWKQLPLAEPLLERRNLWSRLAPYAAWIWLANLSANLFDMADQFLIKHHLGSAADALLGQYYCSRLIPSVLCSVAVMLAGSLLPHLIADWETGRRGEVTTRLNLGMKLVGLSFTGAGILSLWFAPPLFDWAFHGKYAQGMTLLSWTLPAAVWFGMAVTAQKYLACTERNSLITLSIFSSLCVNVVANLLALPRIGLWGAVIAGALGSWVLLVVTVRLARSLGLRLDWGVWCVSLMPVALFVGPRLAPILLLVFLLWGLLGPQRLFSAEERRILWQGLAPYLENWTGRKCHEPVPTA